MPAGTAIGHNLFGLMRSEAVFGSDVHIYRPERFLECEASKKDEMERTVELAFGSGRWMCSGKHVAFIQLHKVLFEILRSFEMQFIDVGKPWEESSAIFWNQKNMMVSITEIPGNYELK